MLGMQFGVLAIALLGFVFAIGVPLGVIIALLTASPGSTGMWIASSASCIAAGSLLYTATVEMISEDFLAASRRECRPILKFGMFICVCLGAGLMSVLAIWA